VQPSRQDQSNINDLQASLDAYLDKHLGFSELRTQWIVALADNPEMCSGAVRLLYEQPPDRHLSDETALSLKRIVETAFHEGPDDATVAFDDDDDTATPVDVAVRKETNRVHAVSGTQVTRTRTTSPKVSPRRTLNTGDVLKDRFVLEESLGRGGMGVVYKAHDRLRQRADAGSAKIALKVLREELRTNPKQLNALQSEALQAQGLSHPNIVRVHDFHQDGETYFITMELLEGELLRSLFSRLQPATLPRNRAMRVIAGMCQGLAHAHAHGLVHADFKPGNVILTAGDEPKILDFGLAQAAAPDGQAGDVPLKPASNALRAITPAYASCSRLEGGAPGFSDDVYSLSCVIYEMLTGQHPYGRRSALVARELHLQPDRIDGLTDLQWRTLATGLQPSREDRTTQVYDLLDAFSAPLPKTTANIPIAKKKDRRKTATSPISRFVLGAALVSALVILGLQLVPSETLDLVREAGPVTTLQSIFADRSNETTAIRQPTSSESSGDSVGTLSPPIVESAAPSPTEVSVDAAAPDANAQFSAPGDDLDSTIDVLLPISPGEAVQATQTASTPGFRLDSAEYYIPENGTALAVQINRQGDISSEASVEWTTFGDSAESQLDFVGFDRGLVLFAAGEASKTIFIPIVSDTAMERDESFQVALSRPGDDMVLAEPFTATVTIIDDDS